MPPFVSLELKVTFAPEQIGKVELAEIVTVGATVVATLITIELELAIVVVMQVALLVMVQLIVCPFVNPAVVYNELLLPTGLPFTDH